jgi:hypothetical protein
MTPAASRLALTKAVPGYRHQTHGADREAKSPQTQFSFMRDESEEEVKIPEWAKFIVSCLEDRPRQKRKA